MPRTILIVKLYNLCVYVWLLVWSQNIHTLYLVVWWRQGYIGAVGGFGMFVARIRLMTLRLAVGSFVFAKKPIWPPCKIHISYTFICVTVKGMTLVAVLLCLSFNKNPMRTILICLYIMWKTCLISRTVQSNNSDAELSEKYNLINVVLKVQHIICGFRILGSYWKSVAWYILQGMVHFWFPSVMDTCNTCSMVTSK